MNWKIKTHPAFDEEFERFSESVQDQVLRRAFLLQEYGPHLGRPYVDRLKGSKHVNMKELRLDVEGGVWRVAFAFDPEREAILLVAADKAGQDQKRFYKDLIKKADKRFTQHLRGLQK